MKQIFCIIMFSLAFATSATTQTDYNYSFYPFGKYTKIQITNQTDSTKKIVPVRDSTSKPINVVVEKSGNKISIRSLTNVSESLYDQTVLFVGGTGNGTIEYRSLSDQKELIYVNPLFGLVIIEFQSCFDEPQKDQPGIVKKHCNIVTHIFGNNNLLNKPSPAPSPQKPK